MFVDEIKVVARAGHGGKGCVAFRREKYRPKGGPSGGNGGQGGSVILEADHDLNNLIAQYYNPRLMAENGHAGLGKGMDGHAGKDLIVKVPCGTIIWRLPPGPGEEGAPSGRETIRPALPSGSNRPALLRYAGDERAVETFRGPSAADRAPEPITAPLTPALSPSDGGRVIPPAGSGEGRFMGGAGSGGQEEAPAPPAGTGLEPKGDFVADLTQHGQQFVLCRGGRGGLGNRNFATSVRQAPRFAQPGEPGEEGAYLLELRLIADIGLVGYPNAGKSTLLTAISKARPKVAPYPFTTLHPQVGIVEYPDFFRLVVCDVPGLIEGAHRNVGLGHAFLRHIERCKILVLVLDMAGQDGRAPWDDHEHLLDELGLYDPGLLTKPRLLVANKMDEPAAEQNLRTFKRKVPKTRLLLMAAGFDIGIPVFKQAIRKAVVQAAAAAERQK